MFKRVLLASAAALAVAVPLAAPANAGSGHSFDTDWYKDLECKTGSYASVLHVTNYDSYQGSDLGQMYHFSMNTTVGYYPWKITFDGVAGTASADGYKWFTNYIDVKNVVATWKHNSNGSYRSCTIYGM